MRSSTPRSMSSTASQYGWEERALGVCTGHLFPRLHPPPPEGRSEYEAETGGFGRHQNGQAARYAREGVHNLRLSRINRFKFSGEIKTSPAFFSSPCLTAHLSDT